jgi:hypothetical protein
MGHTGESASLIAAVVFAGQGKQVRHQGLRREYELPELQTLGGFTGDQQHEDRSEFAR